MAGSPADIGADTQQDVDVAVGASGQEHLVARLRERLEVLERELTRTQEELRETRAKTSEIVASAERRLFWMDKYYLGPETFEKRRYIRILVRGLAFARRAVGYLRKLRRT